MAVPTRDPDGPEIYSQKIAQPRAEPKSQSVAQPPKDAKGKKGSGTTAKRDGQAMRRNILAENSGPRPIKHSGLECAKTGIRRASGPMGPYQPEEKRINLFFLYVFYFFFFFI